MSIQLTDITTGEAKGRGFYDELMRTSTSHIKAEYDAGRIVGADYATVYLGSLQSNLSVAANVIMQYELVNEQIAQAKVATANAIKQGELLDAQLVQVEAQNALLAHELSVLRPLQAQQLEEQIDLLQSQDQTQLAQTTLLATQNLGQLKQNDLVAEQLKLVTAQINTENANTTDATGGQALAALNKTRAEKLILDQKLITETAQTSGQVDNISGANYVTGLVGAELKLKTAQGNSFLRDAEQKAAKFYSDILSIAYSTDPTTVDPDLWGFGPTDSAKVTDALLTGINVAT